MKIRAAIDNALLALEHAGFPPGGDVYDDLKDSRDRLDKLATWQPMPYSRNFQQFNVLDQETV